MPASAEHVALMSRFRLFRTLCQSVDRSTDAGFSLWLCEVTQGMHRRSQPITLQRLTHRDGRQHTNELAVQSSENTGARNACIGRSSPAPECKKAAPGGTALMDVNKTRR